MQRDLIIPGPDGRPIVFDLLLQKKRAPLLLFVHGFKSFKNWGAYDLLADHFHSQGLNVCKFNFSHNGGTTEDVIDFPDLQAFGKNTFSKEMNDIKTLLDHLLTDPKTIKFIDPSQVLLMGHSRGASIATLYAIEDQRIASLITLNGVNDLHAYLSQFDQEEWKRKGVLFIKNGRTKQDMPLYYGLYEDMEKNFERFDIMTRAEGLKIPCLIIHCEDDETVPYSQSKELSKNIRTSELLLLEKGGHTLGATQPWTDDKLPSPLALASKHILEFIEREA